MREKWILNWAVILHCAVVVQGQGTNALVKKGNRIEGTLYRARTGKRSEDDDRWQTADEFMVATR